MWRMMRQITCTMSGRGRDHLSISQDEEYVALWDFSQERLRPLHKIVNKRLPLRRTAKPDLVKPRRVVLNR